MTCRAEEHINLCICNRKTEDNTEVVNCQALQHVYCCCKSKIQECLSENFHICRCNQDGFECKLEANPRTGQYHSCVCYKKGYKGCLADNHCTCTSNPGRCKLFKFYHFCICKRNRKGEIVQTHRQCKNKKHTVF